MKKYSEGQTKDTSFIVHCGERKLFLVDRMQLGDMGTGRKKSPLLLDVFDTCFDFLPFLFQFEKGVFRLRRGQFLLPSPPVSSPFPSLEWRSGVWEEDSASRKIRKCVPPLEGKPFSSFFFFSPQLGIRVFWNRFQKTREKERKRKKFWKKRRRKENRTEKEEKNWGRRFPERKRLGRRGRGSEIFMADDFAFPARPTKRPPPPPPFFFFLSAFSAFIFLSGKVGHFFFMMAARPSPSS